MSPFNPENVNETVTDTTSSNADGVTLNSEKGTFTEIIQFALLALLIVLPIRFFVAQPFIVSGASMEDTFHTNEYLIVDQVSYYFEQPQRGDVIVFRYPLEPSKYFIKRIIGLPGENISIDGNVVTITNPDTDESVVLNEPYIKSMQKSTYLNETLGDHEYFVMGDNRDESSDSRTWGVLQRDRIVGRAFLRLFPFQEAGIFPGEEKVNYEPVTSSN